MEMRRSGLTARPTQCNYLLPFYSAALLYEQPRGVAVQRFEPAPVIDHDVIPINRILARYLYGPGTRSSDIRVLGHGNVKPEMWCFCLRKNAAGHEAALRQRPGVGSGHVGYAVPVVITKDCFGQIR